MAKQHDKQFKLDCSPVLFRSQRAWCSWLCSKPRCGLQHSDKMAEGFPGSGDIPVRGSGNYASDEQKEIARLKRELRDAQDALDVLKKAISILGK